MLEYVDIVTAVQSHIAASGIDWLAGAIGVTFPDPARYLPYSAEAESGHHYEMVGRTFRSY